MSKYAEFVFCPLPITPPDFDVDKFKAKDPDQILLYNKNKKPNRYKKLSYEDVKADADIGPNYARVVPKGCMFIDYDDPKEADEMYKIILRAKLKCLILKTVKGYHFMFRTPDFYKSEMTKATNWFGYKFDCKGTAEGSDKTPPVQIIRVCGMTREEYASWDTSSLIAPSYINPEALDVLPYWLWGKLTTKDLHKSGKTGEKGDYTIDDTPFTRLMTLTEGSRHNHIIEFCSYFALSNGFTIPEFKALIKAIHDQYLVKIGTPMPDSDLFGDLEERWSDYITLLENHHWIYDEAKRKWYPAKDKKEDKIDERRAAEYLFKQYDFYAGEAGLDGIFKKLYYKNIGGTFDYKTDLTVPRGNLREFSDQNFRDTFFKEVEVQLMQLCAENNRRIVRNDTYIIVKNKVLSCITEDAYEFDWLGTRPPTDVVLPWNWYSREWVKDHETDLGEQITWFISQLSRNHRGVPQPLVQDWLWVIAGASMIPANSLQKIIILAGGGQNGKSLYTSLIRLCLGDEMYNESKIFDVNPQDKFWGEDLDKGILCVIDDLPRTYNRESFTYIKGAVTGTDSVYINEKFKPKKRLDVLPQIIACTNFDFELYDKSEGMKRRVKVLPTEYHVDDSIKDGDLQHKMVLNVKDRAAVAKYKMKEGAYGDRGTKVMNMCTRETGVLDSLDHGSLAWFANKARYMYIDWIMGELKLEDSEGMKEKLEDTFSGGFDAEQEEFLEWYITEKHENIWTKDLYIEYQDWHTEMATGDAMMKERAFAMRLGKTIDKLSDSDIGYKLEMKKAKNDKGMVLNKLFIQEKEGE